MTTISAEQVKEAISEGRTARRESWPACAKIRQSNTGDYDYFNADVINLDGVTMKDCEAHCDCNVSIFQWTKEHEEATDWIIL